MRAARSTVAFILGLVVAAWAIRGMQPQYNVATVTPKLEYFAEHGEEFDVIFLGSSRTYRQVLPEIFDREMADAGLAVRSFNLGVDGMRPPEDTYVLEQALATRRKPLKWVFLESNLLRITPREEDRDTVRAMYWHDWPRYAATVHRAFFADTKKRDLDDRWKEIRNAWPDFAEHTRYFLQRSTAMGRGSGVLNDWIFHRPAPPSAAWELGPRKDGYRVASVADQMTPEVRAAYEKDLEAAVAMPPKASGGDPATLADLAAKRRLVERHGAGLVLFVAPFTTRSVFVPKSPEIVLDFSDPRRFPGLYEPRHRADRGHVNIAGSRLFTELLAREFLAARPK
jgi:hypothetical protein